MPETDDTVSEKVYASPPSERRLVEFHVIVLPHSRLRRV